MKNLSRLGLASLIAIQTLFIIPSAADAGWRAVPTTGFVTEHQQLLLIKTITALWVRSDQNGDRFSVYQTLPTVEGDVIDAVAVCYRAEPGTLITAIGLLEFLTPGGSTGTSRHFDDTNLNSQTDTCYVSPVANYAPTAAVSLFLRLQFSLSGQGTIYIGTVAVHVK
jgi:hypothetical protein